MSNKSENPLVTILLMTYNQEAYVAEAVKSVLEQSYEPLEIIISDDCSTDNTWGVVEQAVEAYRSVIEGRKRLILNRNKRNLGIIRHVESVAPLVTGELFVTTAGDDISLPNRVEVIVKRWEDTNKKASVIIHDGIKVDPNNRVIGSVGERSVDCPLGACMAYSSRVLNEFEKVIDDGCYEDHVLGRRAALLGDVLLLKEKLVKYRVGTGVSSVLHSRRAPEARTARARIVGCRQSLLDLDYWHRKDRIEEGKLAELKLKLEKAVRDDTMFLELIEGNSFFRRLDVWRVLYLNRHLWWQAVLRSPYLLPKGMGDFVYGCYDRIKK